MICAKNLLLIPWEFSKLYMQKLYIVNIMIGTKKNRFILFSITSEKISGALHIVIE